MAALIVEAVGHFVSDDHADGSIVASVVCFGIEEGRLQDAGREADFVGRWIVVGVDGLRSHEPFRLVGLLVDALFDVVAAHKLGGPGEVLIV